MPKSKGKPKKGKKKMELQSVIFDKHEWTVTEAKSPKRQTIITGDNHRFQIPFVQ